MEGPDQDTDSEESPPLCKERNKTNLINLFPVRIHGTGLLSWPFKGSTRWGRSHTVDMSVGTRTP